MSEILVAVGVCLIVRPVSEFLQTNYFHFHVRPFEVYFLSLCFATQLKGNVNIQQTVCSEAVFGCHNFTNPRADDSEDNMEPGLM